MDPIVTAYRQLTESFHPKQNERGDAIHINHPDTPTSHESWQDPTSHATHVAGGTMQATHLNGVHLQSWKPTHSDWNKVEGQGDFHEPPMEAGKRWATGVIMHEPDGRVWVVHPTNQFGGYSKTFPKGRLEAGLNPRSNAIKEAWEESGLKARLTGHAADVERTTTTTRYYHAVREGGHPKDMGWESQAVSLVPKDKIHEHLTAPADQHLVKLLKSS